MKKTYKVNADFLINVCAEVEADSEEEARREGILAILEKDCDWLDPVTEPTVNWVEEQPA